MCVVSMIGDYEKDRLFPNQPKPMAPYTTGGEINWGSLFNPPVTREEFESLKKDIEEMKELLKRAKKYDEDNHEPDCQIEAKMELLMAVGDVMGVDIRSIFKKETK
jgi:hypothetical protein